MSNYFYIKPSLSQLFKSWKKNTSYKSLGMGLIIMTLAYDIGGISFYLPFSLIILALAFSIINIRTDADEIGNNEYTLANGRTQ